MRKMHTLLKSGRPTKKNKVKTKLHYWFSLSKKSICSKSTILHSVRVNEGELIRVLHNGGLNGNFGMHKSAVLVQEIHCWLGITQDL